MHCGPSRSHIVQHEGEDNLEGSQLPHQKSGIRREDLLDAPSFERVQRDVAEILYRKRWIVGHSLKHDFCNLEIEIPVRKIRDISHCDAFSRKSAYKYGLAWLASDRLGKNIQDGEHDPFVDALTALQLYYVGWAENSFVPEKVMICGKCKGEGHPRKVCPHLTSAERAREHEKMHGL